MHSLSKLALAGLLMFSVSLTSCKEDSTSPNNNGSTLVKATVGSKFNFTTTDNLNPSKPATHSTDEVRATLPSYAGKTDVLFIVTTDDNGDPMDTTYTKYEANSDYSEYRKVAASGAGSWITYPVASHTTQTVNMDGTVATLSYVGKGSSTVSGTALATEKLMVAGTMTDPVFGTFNIGGTFNFAPSVGYLVSVVSSISGSGQTLDSSSHVLTSYSLK